MQLAPYFLWFKALHIAFMVTWFAGLFYLPRLFIYHAEAPDSLSRERFTLMEKRLFAIMTIGAVITAVFGVLLLVSNPALLSRSWFQIKLIFLAAMVIYQWRCWRWIELLASRTETQQTKGLRWYNEIPVVFLLVIVLLAVLKPF
jgi:putative membrane protein